MAADSNVLFRCSCGSTFYPKLRDGTVQLRCFRCQIRMRDGKPLKVNPILEPAPKDIVRLVKGMEG